MKKNSDSSDVNEHYDGAVRWASTQSFKYQTLTNVRLSKTLSKNKIGKISEIDHCAFWHVAEQDQNRQNYWNQSKCVLARRWARMVYDGATAEQLIKCFYFFSITPLRCKTWRQRQSNNATGFSWKNHPIALSQMLSNNTIGFNFWN